MGKMYYGCIVAYQSHQHYHYSPHGMFHFRVPATASVERVSSVKSSSSSLNLLVRMRINLKVEKEKEPLKPVSWNASIINLVGLGGFSVVS